MIIPEEGVHCADGCGRVATDERLAGLTSHGEEISELVCAWHADHPEEAP